MHTLNQAEAHANTTETICMYKYLQAYKHAHITEHLSLQIMCQPLIAKWIQPESQLSHQIFFSANIRCLHLHQARPPPL